MGEERALIHGIYVHIIVDHFAVFLLFFLDMIERITKTFVGKLENAGIVKMRYVFFACEKVGAKETVGLFLRSFGDCISRGESRHLFCGAVNGGASAVFDLSYGREVISFGLCDLFEEGFELLIVCAGGVFCIFIDTELFLIFKIFEEVFFFLR